MSAPIVAESVHSLSPPFSSLKSTYVTVMLSPVVSGGSVPAPHSLGTVKDPSNTPLSDAVSRSETSFSSLAQAKSPIAMLASGGIMVPSLLAIRYISRAPESVFRSASTSVMVTSSDTL